jgi:hypothetical protein
MTAFTVRGIAMIELDRTVHQAKVVADAVAGVSTAPAHGMWTGQSDVVIADVAHSAGCVVPFQGSLPGPSRRIVVEPIEIPAQPVQVPTETPAEPAGRPEGQPVPAR